MKRGKICHPVSCSCQIPPCVAAVLAIRCATGDALGWRFRPANELSGVKQEKTPRRAVVTRCDLHVNAVRRGYNLVRPSPEFGCKSKTAVLIEVHQTEFCFTNPRCILQDSAKHGSELSRRSRNNANTSDVAVCWSSDSRNSFNSRVFSIAITAWAAKLALIAACEPVKSNPRGTSDVRSRSIYRGLPRRACSGPFIKDYLRGRQAGGIRPDGPAQVARRAGPRGHKGDLPLVGLDHPQRGLGAAHDDHAAQSS